MPKTPRGYWTIPLLLALSLSFTTLGLCIKGDWLSALTPAASAILVLTSTPETYNAGVLAGKKYALDLIERRLGYLRAKGGA